jgi:hypothetical protein
MSAPQFALNIDWDQDGAYETRNDGLLLSAMSIERGRRYWIRSDGSGFEEEETGKFSATLVDLDRDYDPYNTSSPLYPHVGPGRFFRVRVTTPGGLICPLMAGTLSEPVIGLDPSLLTVSLAGADGWSYLRDQKNRISIPLQEEIFFDDAVALILSTIQWPALWEADLAYGVDRHPFWWIANQSAAAAIHDLAFSELGRVYMAGDGKLTFRSRHTNEPPVATITKQDILHGTLNIMEPWETIRNSVEVIAAPRSEQLTEVLWRLPQAIRVNGNSSTEIFIDFMHNNEPCPARGVLQPVPVTDYLANTNSDGTGINLTANFTVVADIFSSGAKLTVMNTQPTIGWLWFCTLRGNAIAGGNPARYKVDDLASQAALKAIRSFTLATDWMQNLNAARAAARFLGGSLPNARKYLSFDLVPDGELQFQLDLGKPIAVYLPDDGIDSTYRVHYLRHEFMDEAGTLTRTSVMAEPSLAPDPDAWILPKRIPMKVAY